MQLPLDFQFSQSSLQDFVTCPRRFELRYLYHLAWPAVESEPIDVAERLARLGTDFHRLVHQHLVGLDVDTLTASLSEADEDLKSWWQHYLDYRPAALAEAHLYPEVTLSTPLRGYRLMARFDLLAKQPDGAWLIIDWKTAQQKPARERLAQRIQSRVYPYVLATAGAAYNGGQTIKPAAIKMMYWYPQAPDQPELFEYSSQLLRRDERFLSDLIEQIKSAAQAGSFPLVEEDHPCIYCVYRSYCGRGEKAGPLPVVEEPVQESLDVTALDWDQIAEIQF